MIDDYPLRLVLNPIKGYIPFEILRGADWRQQMKCVGAFVKKIKCWGPEKKCVWGGIQDCFQSVPLRISNGIALSYFFNFDQFISGSTFRGHSLSITREIGNKW